MAAITATPLVQSPSAQSSASSSSSLATLSSPGSATSASSSSSIATINTLELSSSSSDESSNETAIAGSTRTATRRSTSTKSGSSKKEKSQQFPRHTLLDYDYEYRGTPMRDIAEESSSGSAGPSADQRFVGSRQHLVRSHTVDSVPRIGSQHSPPGEVQAVPSESQPGLNQHNSSSAVRPRALSSRNLTSLGSSTAIGDAEGVYQYTSQLPVSSGSSRRATGAASRSTNNDRSPPAPKC